MDRLYIGVLKSSRVRAGLILERKMINQVLKNPGKVWVNEEDQS